MVDLKLTFVSELRLFDKSKTRWIGANSQRKLSSTSSASSIIAPSSRRPPRDVP